MQMQMQMLMQMKMQMHRTVVVTRPGACPGLDRNPPQRHFQTCTCRCRR